MKGDGAELHFLFWTLSVGLRHRVALSFEPLGVDCRAMVKKETSFWDLEGKILGSSTDEPSSRPLELLGIGEGDILAIALSGHFHILSLRRPLPALARLPHCSPLVGHLQAPPPLLPHLIPVLQSQDLTGDFNFHLSLFS